MIAFALAALIAASSGTYQIETARGPVQLVRGAETRAAASHKDTLKAGDRLVLGPMATAAISDHAVRGTLIGPGELLVNQEQLRWRGKQMTFAAGDDLMQLVLDVGVLQFRGAEVRVRNDGDALYIETLSGERVAFFGPNGFVDVPPKKGVRLEDGRSQTMALPEAPKPLYPAPHQAMRAFRFLWRPVADAASYHIEVATDPMFTELLYAGSVTHPSFAEPARALPIGMLFWRVTAQGKNGFLGIPSDPQPARVAP